MNKPLFDFCLITRNEEKALPRLLLSLEKFKKNGGFCNILDTGSTDNTVKIAKDWGCNVREVGDKYRHTIDEKLADRINKHFIVDNESPIIKKGDSYFDFASARNESASMGKNEWVSFVDADEEVTVLDIEKINEIIKNPNVANCEYNFIFAHDASGNPAIQFTQSKMFNRKKIKWVGKVHEVISPINGGGEVRFLSEYIFKLEHWQLPGDKHSYLVGLAVDCFENPEKDRNSHYFARECLWTGRPKTAIKEFLRHVEMNRWPAEKAQSMIFIGDAYGMLNQPEEQIEW
jgi:glycosyltransferase involved in cell wall biosynthesis